MSLEIYWKKALEQNRLSIDDESLYPLKTDIITRDLYEKDDFIIRKLDTSKFNKKKIYGPKQNPFYPWEKILEIDKIGDHHQLILNKYPVQKGHILLITNNWKPQNGWLDINDWTAIQKVNKDTSGLWFFNSSPIAGASQPHRHFQLLRRSKDEISCPREKDGDHWCICLDRWKQALLDGLAPKVILESTNIVVLESVPLEKLKEYQFNKK